MIKIKLSELNLVASQRPAGYVEHVLSLGIIKDDVLYLEDAVYHELRKKYAPAKSVNVQHMVQEGPGTELKKLIARLGLKPKAGCKCNQRAMEMNRNGPDWCEQNMDLIAGWLREEATRAGYPFTELGAKLLIRRAIKNSRKH